MASSKMVYKVFISSPSDLKNERAELKKAINALRIPECRFEAVLWEDELASMTTDDVQREVNNNLLKDSDILIGLFKSRFGTKTSRADSGTVEEIEESILNKKPVIMYFLQHVISSDKIGTAEIQELAKIQQFKDKYRQNGVYHEVETVNDIYSKWLIKDLQANIKRVQNANKVKESEDAQSIVTNRKTQEKNYSLDNEWFKDSISKKINECLEEKQLGYTYVEDLTFHENILMAYGDCKSYMQVSIQTILQQARIVAFNSKYGNYDYSNDLRGRYPEWFVELRNLVKPIIQTAPKLEVLDVGGNCGRELMEIFGEMAPKCNFTVLDISNEAIALGKKLYPKINFYQGNMEDAYQFNKQFDICFCLRSIQSRGVFRQDALIQMSSYIKKGGLLVISIPNGYIDAKGEIIRGLYDHRTGCFLRERPMVLVGKIVGKLPDYRFRDIKVLSLDTEIVIYARKR